MTDIVMPRLSDSMTEGTVVRWLKQPGDAVRRGEPLVEVETDKATITYECDVDGILTHVTVGEGETVAVGTPIAYVEPQTSEHQAQPAQPPAAPPAAPPPLPIPETQSFAPPSEPTYEPEPTYEVEQPTSPHEIYTQDAGEFGGASEAEERVKASPLARRLARKLGVNIAAIQGSGPDGRIVKEDVEAAADAAAQAQIAPPMPTQAPAPPPIPTPEFEPQHEPEPEPEPEVGQAPEPEYAYEPGEFEQHEDDAFHVDTEVQPLPMPIEEEPAPMPIPESPPLQAPEPIQEPPLIPDFPAPPPAMPAQPAPVAQQPQQPVAPQPLSPPPFVQGMTGNFPAITPQAAPPQQPQFQQPVPPQPQQPAYQPPPQQPIYQQQPQQPVYQQPPPPQPQPTFQPPQQQPIYQQPVQPPQPQQPGQPTATRGHALPIEPTSAQQTVARRMAESKATAPEFFVETEVDMTTCVAFREQLRSMVAPLPSFNDFVIKAAAQALRQYPNVNAAYKDGHFEQYSDVNIGIVVSATELLAVPTLFNVDQKGLAQIAGESQQLSEAVRTRTIQSSQMSGGTFSISNLGMYGVDRFTAILNPPQAAILAVGAINRRAVIAEDGMSLVIRQIMNMTLTCDHRILYGAEAAEFLGAIKAWLESPQLLQV